MNRFSIVRDRFKAESNELEIFIKGRKDWISEPQLKTLKHFPSYGI